MSNHYINRGYHVRQKMKLYQTEFKRIGHNCWDFPGGAVVKNPLANAGDVGFILGSGRFPGGGNSNPLQYSCLENPMDRGACGGATVHGVAKSRTGQSD